MSKRSSNPNQIYSGVASTHEELQDRLGSALVAFERKSVRPGVIKMSERSLAALSKNASGEKTFTLLKTAKRVLGLPLVLDDKFGDYTFIASLDGLTEARVTWRP